MPLSPKGFYSAEDASRWGNRKGGTELRFWRSWPTIKGAEKEGREGRGGGHTLVLPRKGKTRKIKQKS